MLQIAADREVVVRGMRERLCREPSFQLVRHRGLLEGSEHRVVVGSVDDHDDPLVILRGGPQHRRSADVDVLDGLGVRDAGARDRRFERIEVHHEHVDEGDVVLREHRVVDAAAAEQAAVYRRMQRFYPTVHDLRETSNGGYVGYCDAGCAQLFGRAACGHDLERALGESARERHDPLSYLRR